MPSRPADAEIAISLEDARRIVVGQHDDPFSVLGPHKVGRTRYVNVFDPGAARMCAIVGSKKHVLEPVADAPGVFSGKVPGTAAYRLYGEDDAGGSWEMDDAFRFGP
ncbi:MAG: 1,4-alpha-glucan branching enzyme, partial [Boseongicola sp.]|nr:1,4-alpha-glucan branching enzyme [Boseongicola sp.]